MKGKLNARSRWTKNQQPNKCEKVNKSKSITHYNRNKLKMSWQVNQIRLDQYKRETWKGKNDKKEEKRMTPTWLLSVDIAGVDRSR